MKIVIAASECVPFAKTGGLADVVGALPKFIKKKGHDIRIVIPKYKKIDDKRFKMKPLVRFPVLMGTEIEMADIKYSCYNNIPVYFIGNDKFFNREELYRTSAGDYPDNAQRFIFFCKAVLELVKTIEFKPDVIHCNDWQTGLIPAYLMTTHKYDGFFIKTGTVYTIHNLAYQGSYPKDILQLVGIGWEEYTPDRMEYWGQLNFMKAGLVYSEIINTVSETYSKEIQTTQEYGRGLEGVLSSRSKDIYGILNGVDYDEWNSLTDKFIICNYDMKKFIEGKDKCKKDLIKQAGLLFNKNIPVIGMISRLDPQKGLDILADAAGELLNLDLQLIILGKGDEIYQNLFKRLQKKYSRKLSISLTFNEPLAHKIYAGADIFLMPSHFEPCGLGQLISFKYGTIPIVYKTGGLADTVVNYDEKSKRGNGFVLKEYSAEALIRTVKKSLSVYNNKKVWYKIIKGAMKADFSWKKSAEKYIQLYKKAKKNG